jgi:hypothetical protein
MDPGEIAEEVASTFIDKINSILAEIYKEEALQSKYTFEEFNKKYGIN